jgi:hypothetical protein
MGKQLVELLRQEIVDLTMYLITESLVVSQNVAARRSRGNNIMVLQADYWDWDNMPRLHRQVPYEELHRTLVEEGAYDLKFLDGALVQLQYEFEEDSGSLRRARLAFLPSPDLSPFQEQPDLYLLDEVYGDVVGARSVSVPIRLDFDARSGVATDLHHPVSHMTLGQYSHCRIPVASAVTPYYFLEFVLRSFYRTSEWLCTDDLPSPLCQMPRTITKRESELAHIGLPES